MQYGPLDAHGNHMELKNADDQAKPYAIGLVNEALGPVLDIFRDAPQYARLRMIGVPLEGSINAVRHWMHVEMVSLHEPASPDFVCAGFEIDLRGVHPARVCYLFGNVEKFVNEFLPILRLGGCAYEVIGFLDDSGP